MVKSYCTAQPLASIKSIGGRATGGACKHKKVNDREKQNHEMQVKAQPWPISCHLISPPAVTTACTHVDVGRVRLVGLGPTGVINGGGGVLLSCAGWTSALLLWRWEDGRKVGVVCFLHVWCGSVSLPAAVVRCPVCGRWRWRARQELELRAW